MKKPRVEDFDPKSAPPLASPLDEMPAIRHATKTKRLLKYASQASVSAPETAKDAPMPSTTVSPKSTVLSTPHERTNGVPNARTTVRRTTTRYSFEFFHDQLDALRKFALDEKTLGEKGNMSEMVREALDMYISKRLNKDELG